VSDDQAHSELIHDKSARCLWITGLSGAGKTTIGRLVQQKLKELDRTIVYLDGDILREVFTDIGGYSADERQRLALRYAALCKMLIDQNLDVVCATISMFPPVWQWCRANINNYSLIYLRVPIAVLEQRDQKNLYSRARNQQLDNVMGINIPVVEPDEAAMVINNDGNESPVSIADRIIEQFYFNRTKL
jgi:adenylylsulfate kinase-like enzyme